MMEFNSLICKRMPKCAKKSYTNGYAFTFAGIYRVMSIQSANRCYERFKTKFIKVFKYVLIFVSSLI